MPMPEVRTGQATWNRPSALMTKARGGSAMSRFLLACFSLALIGTASAQSLRTNLGTLTCTLAEVAEKQAMPAGEQRAMRCAFRPTEGGVEQTYTGQIRRVGEGQLAPGKLVMIWVVQGPAETKLEPGLLEQTYVGAPERQRNRTASVTLVGERNRDIVMRAETPAGESPSGVVVTVMELKILTVPA